MTHAGEGTGERRIRRSASRRSVWGRARGVVQRLVGRQRPNPLELLSAQADVTARGLHAFATWARSGTDADAQVVRDLEHEADRARDALLRTLLETLSVPIDPEDLYLISERLDAVMNLAKNTVRESQVFECAPDEFVTAIADAALKSVECLGAGLRSLHGNRAHAERRADEAIKAANSIEFHYRRAVRDALDKAGNDDIAATLVRLELYRRSAAIGTALQRVAHRAWFTVLKER